MDFARTRIAVWRDRARERREEGADATAALYDKVAGELQADLERFETEELSLADAMEWSGYSEDRLRVLRKEGKTTWTRRDLPRKPGAGGSPTSPEQQGDEAPGVASLVDRVIEHAQTRRRLKRQRTER